MSKSDHLTKHDRLQMNQAFSDGQWTEYVRFYTKFLTGQPLVGKALRTNAARNDTDVYFVHAPAIVTIYYTQDGCRRIKRVRAKSFITSIYNLI
jgi:hypothetical protein